MSEPADRAGGPANIPRRYVLLGALFGFCFPLAAWALDLALRGLMPSPAAIAQLHRDNPLHWIIDLAPLVLGLFAREIGQRRQAEAELSASEARYRTALTALEEGVVVLDAESRIIACNPSAERILGRPAGQMLGQRSHDPAWGAVREDGSAFDPQDFPVTVALQTGQPVSGVIMGVRRPDGALAWLSINARPIYTPDAARPTAVVSSFVDVTERRRLDAALKRERDFAVQVMSAMGQGLVVTDPAHRIEYANPAFARMLGVAPESLIGRASADLVVEADAAVLADAHARRERGEASTYQVRLQRADGGAVPVSIAASPRWQGAQAAGAISVVTDLTERQLAEAARSASEERFRALTNLAPVGIFQTDLDGDYVYVNDRWLAMTGLIREQALGAGWLEALHPDDREAVVAAWQAARASQQTFALEYRLVAPDGRTTWVHGSAVPLRDEAQAVTGYIGTVTDITESKLAEAAMGEANERLILSLAEVEQRNLEIATLNSMSGLLQSCLTAGEAYAIMRDFMPRLFAGRAGLACLMDAARDTAEAGATWGDLRAASQVFAADDCWALRRGRLHWVEPGGQSGPACPHLGDPAPPVHLCAPMLAQGEALGVLSLFSGPPATGFSEAERQLAQAVADTIALALANLRLRETLRNQSVRDPLTGLFNRRYMEATLERELRRATRHALPVGVIVLDIDHFKHFNDTFGHAAGDALLRELAAFLKANVRAEDVPCRYGGEEFVLILPGAPVEVVAQRAEHLCRQVAELRVVDAGRMLGAVTLSLGVAVSAQHGASPEALLRAADAALYQAKRQGRNQVVIARSVPA